MWVEQLAREMANQVGDPMLAPVRNVPLPFESSQSLGFSEPLPKNARKKVSGLSGVATVLLLAEGRRWQPAYGDDCQQVLGAALMPRSRLLDSPQRGTPSPKPSPKTELKGVCGGPMLCMLQPAVHLCRPEPYEILNSLCSDIMGDSQKPSTPLDRARAVSKIDLFKTIRDK